MDVQQPTFFRTPTLFPMQRSGRGHFNSSQMQVLFCIVLYRSRHSQTPLSLSAESSGQTHSPSIKYLSTQLSHVHVGQQSPGLSVPLVARFKIFSQDGFAQAASLHLQVSSTRSLSLGQMTGLSPFVGSVVMSPATEK